MKDPLAELSELDDRDSEITSAEVRVVLQFRM